MGCRYIINIFFFTHFAQKETLNVECKISPVERWVNQAQRRTEASMGCRYIINTVISTYYNLNYGRSQ